MTNVQVVAQTQKVEVSLGAPRVIFDPQTSNVTVVDAQSSVSVINAGPPGPAGPPGSDADPTPILEQVDIRIATHNQASPVHQMATSGRDFVALFQNGLI